MRPSGSSVASGRTEASRATRQRSSRAGFQMPAVCRSGPQSQPKLQAILRTALNGCGYSRGRAPISASTCSAYARAESNRTDSGSGSPVSRPRTSKR